jgi:Hint domain/FecR protein
VRFKPVLTCLFWVPTSVAATSCLSQPREIGQATSVVPAVESESVGAIAQLEPGSKIFQDGVIRTYKIGAAGLRFLDQTTLTVYPNSSLKLDRFVYNPDRTVLEVGLSLLHGAFRLASGGPKTSEKYTLRTPHVTLGIRGTVVHVFADGGGSIVQALHGAFEGCSTVTRVCKLVQASDGLNGARFWKDGTIELGRFSPDHGVRNTAGAGSVTPIPPGPLGLGTPSIQVSSPTPPPPRLAAFVAAVLPEGTFVRTIAAPPPNPTTAVCLLRGTLVLTPTGEKRIEDLRVGDEVVTRSAGPQTIKWIAKQVFTRAQGRPWGRQLAPIRISKDALGTGRPHQDLIVSPQHCLSFEDALIPAKLLVNSSSIRQIQYPGRSLEYFNIELETHEIIYANGAAVETYCPDHEHAREHWSNFVDYARRYSGQEQRLLKPLATPIEGGRLTVLRARALSFLAPVLDLRGPLERVRDEIRTGSTFHARTERLGDVIVAACSSERPRLVEVQAVGGEVGS